MSVTIFAEAANLPGRRLANLDISNTLTLCIGVVICIFLFFSLKGDVGCR